LDKKQIISPKLGQIEGIFKCAFIGHNSFDHILFLQVEVVDTIFGNEGQSSTITGEAHIVTLVTLEVPTFESHLEFFN